MWRASKRHGSVGGPLKEQARLPSIPVPENGAVIPSSAPGFGMEIREEWITPWDHAQREGERVAVL